MRLLLSSFDIDEINLLVSSVFLIFLLILIIVFIMLFHIFHIEDHNIIISESIVTTSPIDIMML